jgi:glucosyl-3-phosphoglycerate synthase
LFGRPPKQRRNDEMSDFYQSGVVSTLHRLGKPNLEALEWELAEHAKHRPIALVLPTTFSDFQGEAFKRILENLREVRYLEEIVVVMNRTDTMEFRQAKKVLSEMLFEAKIVWSSGPRMGELYKLLKKNELSIGEDGKGRSVWIAMGYVIANEKSHVIALHDCDILTYNRELLARLCYPAANPNMGYEFCKGFYSRVTDRMYGRATRLFFTPLIRALYKILGYLPILVYLDSFRYPLSGEFSLDMDLARVNRIPSDWGLEVGFLAEVYRNCVPRRICQVDLAETFEHKHHELSDGDPTKGLLKMCIDITKTIFRTLSTEGVVLSAGSLRTLQSAYLRTAQDTVKRYEDDAFINQLYFDRHSEVSAVEAFSKGIKIAVEEFLEDPLRAAEIPNWNRVISAIPDFLSKLQETVEEDNR